MPSVLFFRGRTRFYRLSIELQERCHLALGTPADMITGLYKELKTILAKKNTKSFEKIGARCLSMA